LRLEVPTVDFAYDALGKRSFGAEALECLVQSGNLIIIRFNQKQVELSESIGYHSNDDGR